MLRTLLSNSRSAAIASAAASMLAFAVPSQAAVFEGAWDPAFGSAFPDLGWRGEAKFFVPDTCERGTGWRPNAYSCSGMKILSAEVKFYSLEEPNNTDLQETLSFDVPSDLVAFMEFDDGLLAGVIGTFLYSRESKLSIAGDGYAKFTLSFWDDFARMYYEYAPPEGEYTSGLSDINPNDPPSITFRLVPEPGSLPLVFAGLSALGLLVRRRKVA